jgi:hypothetical protein
MESQQVKSLLTGKVISSQSYLICVDPVLLELTRGKQGQTKLLTVHFLHGKRGDEKLELTAWITSDVN